MAARASELSALTYIRCVRADGQMDRSFAGPPEDAPPGSTPWFAGRRDPKVVVFGHWAALGHREGESWLALDSGCVWGEALTAVRLDDRAVFRVDAQE